MSAVQKTDDYSALWNRSSFMRNVSYLKQHHLIFVLVKHDLVTSALSEIRSGGNWCDSWAGDRFISCSMGCMEYVLPLNAVIQPHMPLLGSCFGSVYKLSGSQHNFSQSLPFFCKKDFQEQFSWWLLALKWWCPSNQLMRFLDGCIKPSASPVDLV